MSETKDSARAPGEPGVTNKEVLNFDEAAAFLGISTKTFAKVLRTEDLPGRKVGREWKFSKRALLAWLSAGSTRDYQDDEGAGDADAASLRPAPARAEMERPHTHKRSAPATIPSSRAARGATDAFAADED